MPWSAKKKRMMELPWYCKHARRVWAHQQREATMYHHQPPPFQWSPPHEQLHVYEAMFREVDPTFSGFVHSDRAVTLMKRSNLSVDVLHTVKKGFITHFSSIEFLIVERGGYFEYEANLFKSLTLHVIYNLRYGIYLT
jgi:hypothetical protein